jgi:epoxyqueuosine reductase
MIELNSTEKNLIVEKSQELGFDLIRFTDAEALELDGLRLHEWIKENKHADMHWMEKNLDKRWQPKSILPSAQTVICLASNYFTPDEELSASQLFGRVAKYARGRDYHKIIAKKLKKMCQFLNDKWPNSNHKPYVDTGPILEKALAQKSGIGFVGKNTLVISKEFGSWIFLSEIITDLKITPDQLLPPFGSCGSCRKCIDACPTGALTEYKLDSNKCIAYHTIENKGEIPDKIAKKLSGYIFGCDICQSVCPHNCRAQKTKEEAFSMRISGEKINLDEILSIDSQEKFDKIFAGSPIRRAKLAGLKRNATILKKNIKSVDGE